MAPLTIINLVLVEVDQIKDLLDAQGLLCIDEAKVERL